MGRTSHGSVLGMADCRQCKRVRACRVAGGVVCVWCVSAWVGNCGVGDEAGAADVRDGLDVCTVDVPGLDYCKDASLQGLLT